VKIIRLVSKNTVEEIVLKRAESKIKLTDSVLEEGQVSSFLYDVETILLIEPIFCKSGAVLAYTYTYP